jgi:hypothetical protein
MVNRRCGRVSVGILVSVGLRQLVSVCSTSAARMVVIFEGGILLNGHNSIAKITMVFNVIPGSCPRLRKRGTLRKTWLIEAVNATGVDDTH